MRKSLFNIYVYTFLYSFLLLNPIWVIYLLKLGYTIFYVTILDIIFYVTIVVTSFPMGRLADRYGRKPALIISSITTGIGIIFFGLFTSFAGIALSYVLWGVGVAINSSAFESLTFDYSTSHELKYLEIYGVVNFLSALSVAIASVIGGFVGQFFGLKVVILITGAVVIASSVSSFRIREKRLNLPKSRKKINYSKYIRDRKVFSLLVIRIALLINFNIMILFKQPYYTAMGIGTALIGIIFFVDVLVRGVFSLYSQKLSFIVKDRFTSMLFFTSVTFFTIFIPGLLSDPFTVFLLILNSAIFGFYTNILSEEVNGLIPSEVRASVLSFIFIISALATTAAEPGLGYLASVRGVRFTLSIFSFIFLVMATFAIFVYIQGKDSGRFSLRPG